MSIPFELRHQTVPLSAIDVEKETFRVTTNTETGDLVSALRQVGLINPPILKPTANSYLPVCGYRRLFAARFLSWKSIPARILSEECDSLLCASLAISENMSERPLNLIETSRSLSLLASLVSEETKFYETAEKIGLPHHPSLLKKILPLCRLPRLLQQGILSESLALPSALMLSKLPQETAKSLAEFMIYLKLGLHKQKELIEIVQEIAIRDSCTIENILGSSPIRTILDDPETDIPRKAGLVREHLRKRRFPHLSRMQVAFDRLKKELKLGEHISLYPPPGFEGNRYTLSFSFSNLTELEGHKKMIDELVKDDRFIHLLSSGPSQND